MFSIITKKEDPVIRLNSKMVNISFHYYIKPISISAGSYTNPTLVTIDLSSDLSSGTIIATDVYLGTNKLPYISNGAVRTHVYRVTGRSIIISNTTADAWTNYYAYIFVAVSKSSS